MAPFIALFHITILNSFDKIISNLFIYYVTVINIFQDYDTLLENAFQKLCQRNTLIVLTELLLCKF